VRFAGRQIAGSRANGWRQKRLLGLALAAAALAPAVQAEVCVKPAQLDPYEGWNRRVYAFNEAVDQAVLRPVAQGYQAVVPAYFRGLVGNFFGNLGDAWSVVHHGLQGKPVAAVEMGARVLLNSSFGLGGLLDIASEAGLDRRSEDTGQTLGRWGVKPGPYLMLPLLGPSTVRDAAGLPLDMAWSNVVLPSEGETAVGLRMLGLVDTRASLLGATRMLDGMALDKYRFVRDAFLARRLNLVHDGDVPPEADIPMCDDDSAAP
jgi:phospholipid-binding lipoprotein MlaA